MIANETGINNKQNNVCACDKASVEYPCERSKVHSPKR